MPPQHAVSLKVRSSFALCRASLIFAALSLVAGCGGSHSLMVPPIVLSVTINQNPIQVTAGGPPVYVPVIIMAPTETASFAIVGLPSSVITSYKESESNPSGQLTLMATATTTPGTYKCTVTVGSSGQTASTVVSVIIAAGKS